MCAQPALGLASLIREERKQGSKEARKQEKEARFNVLVVQRPQIHKPSSWVSFGLPDPLSFQVRSHAMVARRSGTKLDRESVRVRLLSSLTRWLGNAMRASQKSKRKKARTNRTSAYVSSTLSMATHNLINMVAITAVSGAALLVLLAAKQ